MPFHRLLYRVAYHTTGNQQDAEDLLQDTYLKLWQKRDDLPPDAQTEAYLITLMRNLYRDQRRLKSNIVHETYEPDKSYEPYEAEEEVLDNRAELQELIEKLPDKQRAVMKAHIVEDKTYEEIERDTGLSNGNIRVIISRAKQTIIKLWKD
ncbi:MAG: RNA polymerase sigma factor [Bacteroidaceae bacterium]|nr:RNA polymerase sigma factor [Bacteroidaceae bacterium]